MWLPKQPIMEPVPPLGSMPMRSGHLITVSITLAVVVIVVGLIDMYRHSSATWQATNRSRRSWTLLTLAFGPLAVLLYWGTVRFDLRDPGRLTD